MNPKVTPKCQSATPHPTPQSAPYVVGALGGGGVGAQSEQIGEGISPRRSAVQHLPQLAAEWSEIKATFGPGVTLEALTTPDGTWGADPTEGWPRVNGLDLHAPWQPPRGRS